MRVPSYDDLTPSIPDVHPRDTFDQVTRLVPCDGRVVPERPLPDSHAPGLFACLLTNGGVPAALLSLAREFSPRIERYADAAVVFDVAGLGRLLGDAQGIADEVARTALTRGIKGGIAIAPTQIAARLLATIGRGGGAAGENDPVVVTGDVATALAPLSLETLQEAAADDNDPPRLFDILRRWGIKTIGEFAALAPADVAARFGQPGVALQRLARGIDPRPLLPDPGVQRFIETMELEWPIEELEPLSFVFARMLDPLASALERADRAGAAVRLTLRLVTRILHERLLQLPAPIRDPRVLRTLLLLDLESHPPSAGIDIVTIEIDPAPSRIVQYSLLERAIPSPETLATLTARLYALSGETRCGSPALLDSYRPDAFEMRRFEPESRTRNREPGTLNLEPGTLNLEPGTLNPEPGTLNPLVLRRFRPAVAIRVALERGAPAHVAIDRKGMPGGKVQQYAGPWRTSGGWWGASERWDRDEWDVALSDGSICRLYRDRATERWFLDGVVD